MKKIAIIVVVLAALMQPALAQQDKLKIEFRFEPSLTYQKPTLSIFDARLQGPFLAWRRSSGQYSFGSLGRGQGYTMAGFGSRFNSEKLSFKELFRDSGFSVRSSDYVPGVKGVKIDKKGGEIWIKF